MLPSVLSSASASCVLAEDDNVVKQTNPVDNVDRNNCIAVDNDVVWRSTTLPAITLYVSHYNVDEDRVTSTDITDNVNDYTSHNGNQEQVNPLPVNEAEEQAKEGYDRYWQTVSVISCFISIMFNNALVSSYGVLYIYLKEPLAVTEYQLSWIGSLMSGFFGITSLLASVLMERVGSRYTHLLGGLILAFSMIVSGRSSSIHVLYLTLGLLSGVGSSLTFVASTVHVSRQFSRWRPLAIGTASIGGAVGSLTWPPLMSGLVETFGWRGALLINGALLLHMLPGALFIKASPKPTSVKGGTTAVWFPMLIIVFDLDSLHRILGGILLMQGIGGICGPPFQSYLADVMAQKDLIFYTTGAFFICSILTILPFLLKKQLVSRQSLRKAGDIKVTGITNKGADLGSTNNFT
ncbi:monocarboxylate transporter 14-like [Haliotis rufescens]|uniref:monocarboxylate transporter 14-like n=1 Tax=Haliotis rufescens TaxID=6454 RepID=UPI00201E8600|nr:monocarboxylate transporter 14-like [Haliotis rufescens]